jgi:hypothetical protein
MLQLASGRTLALSRREMGRRPLTIDERPGSRPAIRTTSDGVTFDMVVRNEDARLVIRRDTNGDLWVSIAPRHSINEWWRT